MKTNTGLGRKLRYGGITVAMTAVIIVAVILVNAITYALVQKYAQYPDLTPELEFTLSESCIKLFEEGDPEFKQSTSPLDQIDTFRAEKLAAAKAEKLAKDGVEMSAAEVELKKAEIKEETMIKIIFCDNEESWNFGDETDSHDPRKHIWKTARDLANKFGDYIKIEFVDLYRHPKAVEKYKKTADTKIDSTNVIVACENEFRMFSLRGFYLFDTADTETPWAYNGEKVFAAAALTVTRASSPIACFTTGHNESLAGDAFLSTLMTSGFEIQTLDLSKEEIPADCRLLVVSNPRSDFLVPDGSTTDVDELTKIEDFLNEGKSLMVFMSPDLSEPLYNFEEFLTEWGIVFDRFKDDAGVYHPYRIRESANHSINSDYATSGENFLATRVDFGIGSDITDIVKDKKIIFTEATSISYFHDPVGYTEEEGGAVLGDYSIFSADGITRQMFPVFVSSNEAVAYAADENRESAANGNEFMLMTVTVQDRFIQEDDNGYFSSDNSSYVFACGCPDFVTSDNMLSLAYGNSTFLESVLRTVGHEPVPTGLTFRPLGDFKIDTVTQSAITWNTVLFTVIPAVLALSCGVVVIVRRKNR